MDTTYGETHPTRPPTLPQPAAPPATALDTFAEVRAVLVRTLDIEDRAACIDAGTGLLGELPELDSLGILELAAALEVRFGIVVDDTDFTGAVFETVGTLVAFVDAELRAR